MSSLVTFTNVLWRASTTIPKSMEVASRAWDEAFSWSIEHNGEPRWSERLLNLCPPSSTKTCSLVLQHKIQERPVDHIIGLPRNPAYRDNSQSSMRTMSINIFTGNQNAVLNLAPVQNDPFSWEITTLITLWSQLGETLTISYEIF